MLSIGDLTCGEALHFAAYSFSSGSPRQADKRLSVIVCVVVLRRKFLTVEITIQAGSGYLVDYLCLMEHIVTCVCSLVAASMHTNCVRTVKSLMRIKTPVSTQICRCARATDSLAAWGELLPVLTMRPVSVFKGATLVCGNCVCVRLGGHLYGAGAHERPRLAT